MNKYQINKENARNKAIEWQCDFENHNYSWGELVYWQDYFTALGKRYGLLEKFRNEGII